VRRLLSALASAVPGGCVLCLAGVALCLAAGACGGTASGGRAGATGSPMAASQTGSSLRGDEDSDNPRGLYDDGDDAAVRGYGHAASAADAQAVSAVVRRYYAAAAAQDARTACALTYYILAESLPEQYGGPPGPLYLRGAGSCQAVLSIVFRRFHAQLVQPPTVTGVRVNGELAYALLGWTALPAGYIEARREGRAWKIDKVLAAPLQ
jgi:hypothetical protein